MLHTRIDTNPVCEIYNGDCRKIISDNLESWQYAFDFIFADPPFNIGHGYDLYYDDLENDAFATFMAEWIGYATYCLRPGGVLAINVPDELVLIVLQTANALSLQRIGWAIWHYRFGQCNDGNWINSKAHCLIFRANDITDDGEESIETPHTWNPNAVLVDSDRASAYNDSRTLLTANPGKRLPLDVWGIPSDGPFWGRVQGNNGERIANHPNQLPEKYLERLILAYTNAGDVILDPFGGTGTTATVARATGRRCVTIDISADYCADIAQRVQNGALRV